MTRHSAVPLQAFVSFWRRCPDGIGCHSFPCPTGLFADQICLVRLVADYVLVIFLGDVIVELIQLIIDFVEDLFPIIEIGLEG